MNNSNFNIQMLELRIFFQPLTNEEIELWNNCLKTGFFKTGVPFGILSYALGKYITRMGQFTCILILFLPKYHCYIT